LEFGNRKLKEPGIDANVFEIKTQGAQVTAEGSTHPDTGGVYKVTQDLPLIPFPPGLMALILELYGKANPGGKRQWNLPVHDGEGRDDFLIQQAGKLRHAGASETVILAHLEEINEDPQIMADPKSNDDLKRIARSAGRYDVPPPEPMVFIAEPKAPMTSAEETPHPVYPDEVWDGTLYGDFADIVSRDNFIPKKFASESFRILTGAIVGDQLTCGIAGGRMRDYLTVIGLRQSGKSKRASITGLRRQPWGSVFPIHVHRKGLSRISYAASPQSVAAPESIEGIGNAAAP